jgi:hypothetical protein
MILKLERTMSNGNPAYIVRDNENTRYGFVSLGKNGMLGYTINIDLPMGSNPKSQAVLVRVMKLWKLGLDLDKHAILYFESEVEPE